MQHTKPLLIICGIVLFVSGLFAAKFPAHWIVAVLANILIAIPAFFATVVWLGARRGVLLLLTISLFAYIIEYIGLVTGFPYGTFTYHGLGPRIFDVVPLALPLAYVPLVLGSWYVSTKIIQALQRRQSTLASAILGRSSTGAVIVIGSGILLLTDLVLDPGAVALHYWSYAAAGSYYGVPLTNFLGWLLTATMAMLICYALSTRMTPKSRNMLRSSKPKSTTPSPLLASGLLLQISFWIGVALAERLWIPLALGTTLLAASIVLER